LFTYLFDNAVKYDYIELKTIIYGVMRWLVKDEIEIEAKVSGHGLIEGTCG